LSACYVYLRRRHSFPTRRSSDLALMAWHQENPTVEAVLLSTCNRVEFYAASSAQTEANHGLVLAEHLARWHDLRLDDIAGELVRSEEHTSELQSRENLVCRLLLE